MAHHDDAPVALFRTLYSGLTWAGLAFLVAVLGWLVWTLFTHTSPGSTRSRALAEIRPTVTALAAAYGTGDGEAGASGVAVVALPATCAACHTIAGTSAAGKVGPELSHVGTVAGQRITSPDYTGEAKDVAAYIRESIASPSKFVVAGTTYGKPGASTMPAAVGQALTPQELDKLVAYLASLK
jgi:mono/diheme cytochrome c family protein